MRTLGSLVTFAALVSGCPEQRDGRVLGAPRSAETNRSIPAGTASNPSASEDAPQRGAPEGPGQDHGTPEDHGAEVCAEGEVRAPPEGDVCAPADAPPTPPTPTER